MKRLTLAMAFAALALTPLPAAPSNAQEGDPMAMMAEMATPGEEHEALAKMVGSWTYTQKTWMMPGQPPMEATGTMTAESMLDGRFVKAVWSSEMMGQPFTGIGINGYDKMKQLYTNVWMDSMMTSTMMFTGETAGDLSTTFTDPMTGNPMTMRVTTEWTGDDTFTVAGYITPEGGEEMQNMEVLLTRSE